MAGQKSGIAYGLDPDTGMLRWQTRLGRGGVSGGVHFGIAARSGRLYVPITDTEDGRKVDFPHSPGLYAVDAASGKKLWASPNPDSCKGKKFCTPALGAAITATPGLVFAGSDDGHLRAYDDTSGKVLWDMDTDIAYTALGGARGHGGSLAGSGAPVIWHGMVYVGSGHGFATKMPGNVLLALGVD